MFTLLLVLFPAAGFAHSLAELDRIQDEAADPDAFLGDPALVARYVRAFQAYAGGRGAFPEVSAERILSQLRRLLAADPSLARRAWAKTLGDALELELPGSTHLNVRDEDWARALGAWRARLRERAGAYADWWTSPTARAAFTEVAGHAEAAALAELQAGGNSRAKLDALAARHAAVASALLLYQLEDPTHADGLRSRSWATVTSVIDKITADPALEWPSGLAHPRVLRGFWKTLEPELYQVTKDPTPYCDVVHAKRVVTIRRVRPWHAFFRGLLVNECVGGDPRYLEDLSPRRWAIPLLEHAWVQVVEEDGHARGFLQGVALVHPRWGEVDSVDYQAGVLREMVDLPGGLKRSIFEVWLARHDRPVVLGHGLDISNEQMPEYIRRRRTFLFGRRLSDASTFRVKDGAFAARLSALAWSVEDQHRYGESLIFDATDARAGELRLLDPSHTESVPLTFKEILGRWNQPRVAQLDILRGSPDAFARERAKAEPEPLTRLFMAQGVSREYATELIAYLAAGREPHRFTVQFFSWHAHPVFRKLLGDLIKPLYFDLASIYDQMATAHRGRAGRTHANEDHDAFLERLGLGRHGASPERLYVLDLRDDGRLDSVRDVAREMHDALLLGRGGGNRPGLLTQFWREFHRLPSADGDLITFAQTMRSVAGDVADESIARDARQHLPSIRPTSRFLSVFADYARVLPRARSHDLAKDLTPVFMDTRPDLPAMATWLKLLGDDAGVERFVVGQTAGEAGAAAILLYGWRSPEKRAAFVRVAWPRFGTELKTLPALRAVLAATLPTDQAREVAVKALGLAESAADFVRILADADRSRVFTGILATRFATAFLAKRPNAAELRGYVAHVGDDQVKARLERRIAEASAGSAAGPSGLGRRTCERSLISAIVF